MYQNFFGLSKSPFEARADARFFYATSLHEEMLAALQYEACSGSGSALVVGEAGIGKTQLVRQLVLSMKPADRVVVITWPPNGQINVLREVCKGFGLDIPAAYSEAKGLARLRRQLINIDKSKGCAVVILDQAENLCADAMMQVAMMAGLGQQSQAQLRLVLVGQPRVTSMLSRPEFSQLKQQLYPPRQLPALTIEETKAYLEQRLHVSGASKADVFSADAVEIIHSISSGLPRLINKIADAAMMAAYGAQLKHIGSDLINELDFPVAALDVESVSAQIAGRKSVRGEAMQQSKELFRTYGAYSGGLGTCEPNLPAITTTPSSIDTQTRLDRLERVLARAERMQVTLEASTAQRLAVEKHLTSLTDGADAISANLAQAVERSSQGLEQIEKRVEQLFASTQRRINSNELKVQQIAETSSETAEQVAQAERVCERAEELENRLASFAEQVADRADDVQRHVSDLVGGVAAGEKTRKSLETMATQQQEAFDRQTALVEKMMTSAKASANEALQQRQDSLKERETQRQKFDALIKESMTLAKASADEALRQRQDSLNELEAYRQKFEVQVKESTTLVQVAADEAIRQRQDSLKELEAYRQKFKVQVKESTTLVQVAADEAIRQRQDSLNELEAHRQKFKVQTEAAQALITSVEDQRRAIETSVECGEKKIIELNGHFARVDVCQRKVTDGLVEFGALAQRVGDASQAAEHAVEHSANKLGQTENHARQLEQQVGELEQRIIKANENLSRFQSESTDSLENALQIRAQLDKSVMNGKALTETLSSGQERVLAMRQQAKAVLKDAEQSLEHLQQSREVVSQGDQTLAELSSVVASIEDRTNQFEKQMENAALVDHKAAALLANVNEKVAQLDSHQAKAADMLSRLSSANINGENMLKQTTKQMANVESTVEGALTDTAKSRDEIERLMQDVWSLTTKTETLSQSLEGKNLEAVRLSKQLALAIAPANKLANAIDQKVQQAKQDVDAITGRTQQAGELLKQLKTAGRGLEDAKKAAQIIGETLTQAKDIQATLDRALQTADQRADLLCSAGEDVSGLLDRHEQLQQSSESTLVQLTEAIGASEGSSEVAERLMVDFLKQSADIGKKLELMSRQSGDLEQRMADQMHQPMELISTARAQAAQLEQVCGAVRKVFAGLSKASLDAQQQIRGVDAIGQTTANRLEGLINDSQAAGQIVKEWVDEAVRVQARLQGSIEAAPSIRDTHAGAELERISKRIDSVDAADVVRTTTALTGKNKSLPTARKQSLDDRIANPSSRVQQVARLLEEAKQGAVEAGSRL